MNELTLPKYIEEKTLFGVSWNSIQIAFAVWTILGLSFASESYLRNYKSGRILPVWIFLIEFLTEFYLYALLSIPVFMLGKKFPLRIKGSKKTVFINYSIHLIASIIFSIVNVFTATGITWLWQREMFPAFFTLNMILDPHFLHRGVVVYWGIIVVGIGIEYFRGYNGEKLRVAELSSKLSDARLNALKMQIHPHFLFNTLNSIVGLIQEDRKAAEEMTTRLSDFLRMTLQSSTEPFVTLEKEIHFLKTYLDIEKIRFQERLTVEFKYDEKTASAKIPNLILQPLVENSIKHGINNLKENGKIEISARRDGNRLILKIFDNGNSKKPKTPDFSDMQSGLGLKNTQERLQQIYGENFSFDIKSNIENGITATIDIPFED